MQFCVPLINNRQLNKLDTRSQPLWRTHKLQVTFIMAVSIRWTGLGTGLWDWTVGLDSQKVALIVSSD